jgi:hypothetical protein
MLEIVLHTLTIKENELCFKSHFNWRFMQEIMALKSYRNPNFESFGTLNLGVLRQNDIWMQPSLLIIENNIKGKVVVSPSLGRGDSYVFVYSCDSSVHQKCSNYATTNFLFDLCKFK